VVVVKLVELTVLRARSVVVVVVVVAAAAAVAGKISLKQKKVALAKGWRKLKMREQ